MLGYVGLEIPAQLAYRYESVGLFLATDDDRSVLPADQANRRSLRSECEANYEIAALAHFICCHCEGAKRLRQSRSWFVGATVSYEIATATARFPQAAGIAGNESARSRNDGLDGGFAAVLARFPQAAGFAGNESARFRNDGAGKGRTED